MSDFDSLCDLMVCAQGGNGRAMGNLLRGLSPKLRLYIKRQLLETAIDDAAEMAAIDDAGAADARRDLNTLLDMLPSRTRRLIEAVKLEGMTAAEAAERAGMSEAAVKVAVHRGLKRLSSLFGKST